MVLPTPEWKAEREKRLRTTPQGDPAMSMLLGVLGLFWPAVIVLIVYLLLTGL